VLWSGVRGPQKKETGAIVEKWVAGAGLAPIYLLARSPDLFSLAFVFSGAPFLGLGWKNNPWRLV
jgi:hypothetical protein